MTVTYGEGFAVAKPQTLAERVAALQDEISKHPQYEPPTEHVFHGGMYCRQVWRPAGCLIVGKVHKKEHFYMIVSGTVKVTTDDGVQTITGPMLLCSNPGTKRAVYAETDALCMTFHRVESNTVEEVESELVEDDPNSMFTIGNKVKNQQIEVKP
jgi:quercetin dioxygenase-like cupin family protein